MKYFPSLFLVPILFCLLALPGCSGDNRDDVTMEIDEVTPIDANAYIEYRGAKSAVETGYGYVCSFTEDGQTFTISLASNLEPFDEDLGTGGEFSESGQFAVFEFDFGPNTAFRGVVLAVEQDGALALAQCEDCVSTFVNNGSTLSGAFSGDFFVLDPDTGRETAIGVLEGDFNVPIEVEGFDCDE